MASGNRCFHAFIRLLKASTLPRKLKVTVYRVTVRPVVLCGCETYEENRLLVWERKVLRKIFGAVCEEGEWRIRTNDEVYKLYCGARTRRLQYLGHVVKMEEHRVPRKILEKHPAGRPRKR
jgi:hypothetical protein